LRFARTLSSSKNRPDRTPQSRIVRKSTATPLMTVRQFPAPPTAWAGATTTGETAVSSALSRHSLSASSSPTTPPAGGTASVLGSSRAATTSTCPNKRFGSSPGITKRWPMPSRPG
jgi:hypothetical protein